MNFLIRLKHAIGIFMHYYVRPNPSKLGYFGKNAALGIPADLKKPENIYMYEHSCIGSRSTILSVGESRFIMGKNSMAAEGLTVITSNHRQRIGSVRDGSNSNNVYKDIIVEEDVWLGINVTLLYGSHIGRGCTLGAGVVCRRKIPPYTVVIGNPARIIKFRYSVDEIIEHEKKIYSEKDRIPREVLEKNYQEWLNNKDKRY